ncbi:aspartyl-phosphate phosphatase Spo0E family protein [Halalkalibacter alkalisediminis]|uniref:Aspartyl-phosphate phosphatase Spo0E family protein n=1 Tax=Halalkalibacter alkalisediminis TaxID=935616 RepID=A0ABV6NFX2_9BACI|nr:aspartyl-phosphate phosphatase Spo0E family protein [Halalkalibacter alkalisediminis]
MENKQFIITDLENKIESTRNLMILTAQQNGLNHTKTIILSQKLDDYLNEYQRLSSNSSPLLSHTPY